MKVPLHGSVEQYGEYFIQVLISGIPLHLTGKAELGDPINKVELQVDTGSTDLLVYGQGCRGCPSNADRYDWKNSRTAT